MAHPRTPTPNKIPPPRDLTPTLLSQKSIALFTLHKLTWVRPRLKLSQVSCSRVYNCAFQICSVNEKVSLVSTRAQ